tara:strand:+ start:382 stop:573 length:192 start_codon:yes stop_codon:yes gene_type:complete
MPDDEEEEDAKKDILTLEQVEEATELAAVLTSVKFMEFKNLIEEQVCIFPSLLSLVDCYLLPI